MNTRIARRIAALSLAACLCVPCLSRAAVPEEMPPPEVARSAAKDTSRFLPRWVHLHAAFGVGWLASPLNIRQLYQAGESYELGFEARPASAWRLRLNTVYQTLPIVVDGKFVFATGPPAVDGKVPVDTLTLEGRGQGWIGSEHLELQKALIPGFWVLGGVGGGFVSSGLRSVDVGGTAFSFEHVLPGSSGWALMTTLGASAESDILGPTLGVEVRWAGLMQSARRLQTWSIRVGWQGF